MKGKTVKQLSKSEYKYRYKFIYENHLNKYQQMMLDKIICGMYNIDSYKDFYFEYRRRNPKYRRNTLLLTSYAFAKTYDTDNMLNTMSVDELINELKSSLPQYSEEFEKAIQYLFHSENWRQLNEQN